MFFSVSIIINCYQSPTISFYRNYIGCYHSAEKKLFVFFYYGVYMNLTLAIFNLLPVPPLDGSRILFYFLPPKWYYKIAPYERYITLAVMLLLLLGPLSELIGWLTSLILRGLFALVGMPGFLL